MWKELLLRLYLIVPVSGLFMIWTREKRNGWGLHLLCLIIMTVILGFVLGYDIRDMIQANLAPTELAWNPSNFATDRQWCLVYGGQPGTELVCANTGPCTPDPPVTSPVTADDLSLDGVFVFRFVFLLFLFGFLIFDWLFSTVTWYRALSAWLDTLGTAAEKGESGLQPMQARMRYKKMARQ
jgi:hypothetical protein